jgi:hypothetical protein
MRHPISLKHPVNHPVCNTTTCKDKRIKMSSIKSINNLSLMDSNSINVTKYEDMKASSKALVTIDVI